MVSFEWDENKNNSNKKKHKHQKIGLSFEEAQEVFEDPFYIEKYDSVHSTDTEDRYTVLGRIKNQLVVVVIYTPRNNKRNELKRIISARYADKIERNFYYDRLRSI